MQSEFVQVLPTVVMVLQALGVTVSR